ncbi:transposase [Thalassotalea marina]|uniref:Transposase n=1 Tax=Thalassotalea marina TaxID=1673741 RepID=A0A919EN60_9GAMM|nr:transposase [Thalassotalea marina]GHF98000.1 transposase [Thalassotalea marina]
MPRRARVTLPNVPHHVVQRGNNRQVCFFCNKDYQYYLKWLEEYAKRYFCDVHAFVLMTNHVHLLITPRKLNSLCQIMKQLGQRYVQYINRKYGRSGTLWEGRFKSCMVQCEDYLLNCYRYIELNPIRANMTTQPSDYPWSSYKVNAFGAESNLITEHIVYTALGVNTTARLKAYRELFLLAPTSRMISDIRESTNGNFVLGNDKFKNQIENELGRRVTPAKAGRPRKKYV